MAINKLQIPYPDFKLHEIIDPEQFDLNNAELQDKINTVIAVLNQITDSIADGSSGADKISLTAISPFISTKLQSFLEEVISRLQSTQDGSSGADFIASTPILGVTGKTVQEQLESLKSILDSIQTQINSNTTNLQTQINTHKISADHDTRYYTKTQLDNGQLDGRYYTRASVDSQVTRLQSQINTIGDYAKQVANENKTRWLTAVNTYADIATTYPNPQLGDTVQTISDSKIYRWNGTQWVWTQQYNANAITDVQNKIGILYKNEVNVFSYGVVADGISDDTQKIQNAINDAHKKQGKVKLPAGKYFVSSLTLPVGVTLEGATDAFYSSGFGIENLTILITDCTTTFMTLKGANHVKNIVVLYKNQTYTGASLIDTGVTFKITYDTATTEYSKGCLIEGVSVIGGTTVIENLEASDYFSVRRLSFTPNHLKPSIRVNNAYDVVRFDHIHCNVNIAWSFSQAGVIPSNFSTAIVNTIKTNGKLFEFGRVDELQMNNPFAYGVAYPITVTTLLGVNNGGITINNAVFDATYRVFTIDAPVTNFGIQINGLKAVFITSDESCLFYFTANSSGTRVQATNVYVSSSEEKIWRKCIFDTGSNNNRVIVSNFNFHNSSANTDNGINNYYYDINGYAGSDGLKPSNLVLKPREDYYIPVIAGGAQMQYGSSTVSFSAGETSKTLNIPFPNGSFSSTPKIIATLGDSGVGYGNATIRILSPSTTGFTIRIDLPNGAGANGGQVVNWLAIG